MSKSCAGLWSTLLMTLLGCGSPVDAVWAGTESACSNNLGSNSSSSDVELTLDGPVTLSPSGTWRISNGGGSWIETPVDDASYLGTSLKFSTTFTITVLGLSASTTTDYELSQTPGHLKGTAKTRGDNPTTCQVSLTPKK